MGFFGHGSYISRHFHLFTCGGSLAVSWIRGSIRVMEIWVMKEYAVEGTWTRLSTIRLDSLPVSNELEITGFVLRENAHVLLSVASDYGDAEKIFLHDLKSQETKKIKTPKKTYLFFPGKLCGKLSACGCG